MNRETGRDPWPDEFRVDDDGRIPTGVTIWSLPVEVQGFSGKVEGRTTGSRRVCAAPSCGGWFIGVKWETGQFMSICSRGWEYDPATSEVTITRGSGMSTTIATDRPNTRKPPPPRVEWPERTALGPAWQ